MSPTSTQPPAPEPLASGSSGESPGGAADAPDVLSAVGDAPELLAAAVERAVQTARRDRSTRGAPEPPAALRPFLGFTRRIPPRAQRAVLGVLHEDDVFRERVAQGADEGELGRASLLFLTRPESWEKELAAIVHADAEERQDIDAARSEVSAQRRLEQLSETVERLRADLAEATTIRVDTEAAASGLRADVLSLGAERDDLTESVARLESERARAVRELKAAEAIAADRLANQRRDRAALEAALARVAELESRSEPPAVEVDPLRRPTEVAEPAQVPVPGQSAAWADSRRRTAAAAIGSAATAARALGAALAAAAEALADDIAGAEATDAPDAGATASPSRSAAQAGADAGVSSRPPRRVPVRLRGGVVEGTVEGLRQLLANASIIAIVDGYNVTMQGWPSLDRTAQRDMLVRSLGALQAQVGSTIHVVFDGDADGARPHVAVPLPIRVHFSDAETEADDVILSTVADLPTDTAVLVVSSDRRVADGARRLGANVASSSELLDLLRS